jgi:hypothetical protein
MAWIQEHWGLVFGVLFAVDNLLAAMPNVASNSVFQLIANLIAALGPKPPPAA